MNVASANTTSRPREPPTRRALSDAWALSRPFWLDSNERRSWAMLLAVVALTLIAVWLNVRFSLWNNAFYDALQKHDLAAFWKQIGVFCALATGFIVAAVYRQYLQQLLVMRWRTRLTDHLLQQWLQPGTAYRIATRGAGAPDNPDQRISDDASSFATLTLDLSLGLLNACVTLGSFVGMLWGLSGTLSIGQGLQIHGYMVWVAIAYSLGGSWINHRLGRRLTKVSGQQQQVEADFRYTLVQVRDHAESIALAGGERREHARLALGFEAIRANWSTLIRLTKRLTWFGAGYGQIAIVFPLLVAAPRYFAGALQLGGLMQTAQAFGQVQGALSWFVNAYSSLASWRATVLRLVGFVGAMSADSVEAAPTSIRRVTRSGDAIAVSALTVAAPNGRALVSVPARRLDRGEHLLISGPSGGGKSSIVRAIAGIWREGSGVVEVPAASTLMFVPQRPYLPDGTLREALAYPHDAREFSTEAVNRVALLAGLRRYAAQLDAPRRWSALLSPGEQQRVHFARVMLQCPDWVFLDESTSALDETAERELYAGLRTECPATTVVSVGHRSTLVSLHSRRWSVGPLAVRKRAGTEAVVRDGLLLEPALP